MGKRPMTVRIARWSAEHPWRAIALWVVFVAICFVGGNAAGLKEMTDEDMRIGEMGRAQAIIASGDRTPRLRSLSVPTLVIHGAADPFVDPSGGRATAAAIPGARLVEIEGMGHDLPRPLWPQFADLIAAHVHSAA